MNPEPDRSRAARQAAESALVRVVHEYGRRPEFVVLGGLVPELLCSASDMRHAGTTDIDVQVNLEIASDSVNAASLEQALMAAGLSWPSSRRTSLIEAPRAHGRTRTRSSSTTPASTTKRPSPEASSPWKRSASVCLRVRIDGLRAAETGSIQCAHRCALPSPPQPTDRSSGGGTGD